MVGASLANGTMELRAMWRKDAGNFAFSMELVGFFNRYLVFPGLVMLPLSGVLLALTARYSLTSPWILYSIILAVLLFIPFFTGYKMESALGQLAKDAVTQQLDESWVDSVQFKRASRKMLMIGGWAAPIIFIVLYMMIAKRLPFGL